MLSALLTCLLVPAVNPPSLPADAVIVAPREFLPALNPLIKVMNLTGILIAGIVIQNITLTARILITPSGRDPPAQFTRRRNQARRPATRPRALGTKSASLGTGGP